MKIMFFSSCRADYGLIHPVIDAIKNVDIEAVHINLENLMFDEIVNIVEKNIVEIKPSAVFCPCDRKEQVIATITSFYKNIPIIAMDLGETDRGSSYDTTGSFVLTRLASLIFTNTEEGRQAVIKSGEEPWRVHSVGYTFLDGIELKSKEEIMEKYNLPEDYDIVIYNPDVYSVNRTRQDLEKIFNMLQNFTVILRPNHDTNDTIVDSYMLFQRAREPTKTKLMDKFDTRDDFLSALKYCKRLIGNSSCILHEAPYFNVECIHIGERNKGRKPRTVNPEDLGASERIAKTIKDMLDNKTREELLRKKVLL